MGGLTLIVQSANGASDPLGNGMALTKLDWCGIMTEHKTALEANEKPTHLRGMGGWRRMFLAFIEELQPQAVVELGSGDPAFLAALPTHVRRLALDGNEELHPLYERAGIEFRAFDFDHEEPPVETKEFNVAVCSDVFEHLLYPQKALRWLSSSLSEDGVLFSHVPNEYRLRRTAKIMLGMAESIYYFPRRDEWNYPHLRKFTDVGYRRFLQLEFKHNLKITDLNYAGVARLMGKLGLSVPYCLEGGPTYASTNNRPKYERLCDLKAKMGSRR